jgi:hypothetical protein
MNLSNYPGGFANGVAIQGMPVLNTYSGKVFWVDDALSGGSNGNKGTFDRPWATIDYAIGRCTAGRGDIIMVKAGYAETVTAQIDLDVAGVAIVGNGWGWSIPQVTGNGAIDVIDVSAANCLIANIGFPAPETDAQTADINVDAAGFTMLNTQHVGSQTAKNKVDLVTLTANADNCLINGLKANNDVVECVGGIKFEGACDNVEVGNVSILDTVGFTNGSIYDAATATNIRCHHSTFSNAKADTVVMEWGNNSTGVCEYNFINGRHTTIQSNVTPGTGMAFNQNLGVEEAAKNGILIPVADAD